MATAKKDVVFNVTSLDKINDKKLNEIIDKVLKTKKGASALKSVMRSVMRSTLRSAVKSAVKSPARTATAAKKK
jgi:hypothetical protein